jgi:predicted transposase YbfD/YdcC
MVLKTLGLRQHFRTLRDPRRLNCCQHLLLDVIAIAICAVIANADDWQGVETFGHDRIDWLKTFLKLPNGIPSHDTFERIFDALDPQAFQQCLLNWFNALRGLPDLKQVAIDGKVLRGSGKGHGPLGALHLVNAWATEQGMHLGQVAVDADSNEITAVPKLLELLALEGALVTLDAMHCPKETAQKIRERGGDYLLTVKGNQQQLRDEIEMSFVRAFDGDMIGVDHDRYETEDKGHGRREKRVYTLIYEPEGVDAEEAWKDLHVIGQCYRERTEGEKTTTEMVYFIGSRRLSARRYGQALRGHWGIENSLHWQVDVTFGEDANREQGRIAGQNLAGLRRLALSLLRQHPSKKSMAQKRLSAAYNTDFLEEILASHSKLGKS